MKQIRVFIIGFRCEVQFKNSIQSFKVSILQGYKIPRYQKIRVSKPQSFKLPNVYFTNSLFPQRRGMHTLHNSDVRYVATSLNHITAKHDVGSSLNV